MKQLIHRGVSLLVLLALMLTLLPVLSGVPTVNAANLSTDIYQLPSKTLNDAGTKYRQNMSYIIRTRNGKIIVIDGGYSNNNSDANYLISQLKSITGKTVPNVDAWFFTHDHGDHVGAFKAIAARMPTSLTVDTVYYRFATDAEIDKYAPEADRASLKTSVQSFRNHVAKMKKADGTPTNTVTLSARYVDHCNGVFTIDTVQIDVLMTCQEVFWGCDNITTKYSGSLSTNGKAYTSQTIKQLVAADFGNNTTAVFRMTTMGQSVLFLGDAAEPEGLMLKYYHDKNAANSNNYFSLKSDIVQMAHHGQNAVPKSVYVAIDPDIALWPSPDWVYSPSSSSELTTNYTKQWMKELGVTNYVSKDGLKKISLSDLRTPDVLPAIPEEMKPLVFDATYYANKYADVKKAFGSDEAKLYDHFLKYGIEEGRCASPYFDIKYYMSQNSLKMSTYCKGNYERGFDHFIKYAYEETELTGGGAKKLSPLFDCKYYYKTYPILKELGLRNEFEVLQYFVNTGKAAGHKGAAEVVTLNGGIVYHTVSNVAAVAPTCTAEGKTAGTKCATCGLVLKAQTAVAAKGHSYTSVITSPTCTVGGFTTYTCSTCGDTYTADPTEAAGHSYTSVITAPTCTVDGFTTYTCSTCGDTYTADPTEAPGHSYDYADLGEEHRASCSCSDSFTESHSFEDGLCICGATEQTVDEAITIGHTLNLASDISINFAVRTDLLDSYDSYIMEIKVPAYNGNEKVGTETLTIEPVENNGYYYFTLSGLTAIHMNDMVEATVYMTKNGRTYTSNTDHYSIATYAYNQLGKPGAAQSLKKMCADLLRYGSKAQIFKSYRTDALVDSAMTEDQCTFLTDLETVTFGNTNVVLNDLENAPIKWEGKALNLESKVCLKFIFSPGSYTGNLSELSLRVTYADNQGVEKTLILSDAELYNATYSYYAFTLDALLAAELRSVVSVQIFSGETPVSCTLQYSADTYGNNKTGNLLELCKALFAYSDSAAAFFTK